MAKITTIAGDGDSAPVLSASALSKLSDKINAGIQSSKTDKKKPKARKEKKKTDTSVNTTTTPTVKPREAKKTNGSTKSASNIRPAKAQSRTTDETNRGKKRDRSGSVKDSRDRRPQPAGAKLVITGTNTTVLQPRKNPKKEALLKEILALGGTEEDLALVGDLESDSDEEETIVHEKAKGKSADKQEIEDFMKEIGLGKTEVAVIEDDEAEDEILDGEDEGEEDDNSDQDKIDIPPPKTGAAKDLGPKSKHLILEPRPDWHAHTLQPLPTGSESPGPPQYVALVERAKALLAEENAAYTANNLSKSSNRQFLSQIMTSGTLSDKISALTLVCQESPLHTMKTLESLLGLAKKKSRSQTIAALNAIKDLFASGMVLPSNRKLKAFSKQPVGDLLALQKKGRYDQQVKEILVVWAFEDWLKTYFFEVLKVLETVAGDGGVTWTRTMAVNMVFELLKEKPEGEANLLRVLVNKLGDTDKKVASKTSYLLLQLQISHPAMKGIIISSIESEVLFRSGNNQHAKYYSVITLNQTILNKHEPEVANQLLKTYFAVFTSLLKKKEPIKPKTEAGAKLSKKAKKRMQDAEHAQEVEEEANSRLVSAVLTGVNRAFPFSELDDEVFQKHMDTIFRITHSANFNTSIQALMLIFQVANSKQMVTDRFYRTLYDSLLDPRLAGSSKQAMYLNLVFRAIKADSQMKRVKSFVKRIIQTATMHSPAYICGVLYLLHEVEKSMPSLRSIFDNPEEDESDEEDFKDVVDEDMSEPERVQILRKQERDAQDDKKKLENAYDGKKRDPLFTNADRSCLWELSPFLSHFHPTVALFAEHLLRHEEMPSKPDLSLHTLSHFLDRFVYRNAKSSAKASNSSRGGSIMQPLAGGDTTGMVLSIKTAGRMQAPVNTEAFWRKKVEDVPIDEVFFHKYFSKKRPTSKAKKTKEREGDVEVDDSEGGEDVGDENSAGEEDEIWDALVESKPDLEMDADDDDDVDMDDFEDLPDLDDDDDDDEGGLDEGSDVEDISLSGEDADGSGPEGLTTDTLFADAQSDDEAQEVSQVGDDDEDDDEIDFGEADSDALDSDDEIPSDVDEQLAEIVKKNKRAAAGEDEPVQLIEVEDRKSKRRRLKNLPTFASADDYAALMGDDDDDL